MTATAIESVEAIRRRQFIRLSAGSLAALATGCTPRASTGRDSTLIVAFPEPENGMNPATDVESKLLVFLPLLARTDSGDLEGRLADRWEHSPDYREWTFHLRQSVHWHDGVPVTAHDVKFSFELLTHPAVGELSPGDAESITVIDDSTVRLRWEYGANWANNTMWEVVFPKHLLGHLDATTVTEWEFWTQPIGDGPYRFIRRVPRTLMEFEANPDYYQGKPRIERVVLKFARGAELAELRSGNVDIVMGASPAQSALETSAHGYYGFRGIDEVFISQILWNAAHPLFTDARVRRALTHAIDRRELARLLYLPDSVPIVDGPLTTRQLRLGELPAPLPFDPAHAGLLLDEAGWRQQGGSTGRDRDGRPFHFTLLVPAGPSGLATAVYVREALLRVGISMEIQTLEGSVIEGALRQGRFDATLRIQRGDVLPFGYRNPDAVALLERRRRVVAPAEIDSICRRLTELYQVDAPATYLFPSIESVLARPRVRGLTTPWHADPIVNIGQLWLDNRSPA